MADDPNPQALPPPPAKRPGAKGGDGKKGGLSGVFSAKRLGIEKANSRIFIAVVAASIVVSFSLVTLNFFWNLRAFNARVIEARSETLDTLDGNLRNLESLKLSFNALESSRINSQVILDALPSKYDFPALATSIEKQLETEGLTLRSFGGEDLSALSIESSIDPAPEEIAFSIDVDGSYQQLVNLIDSFERTIRPLTVESIIMAGTNNAMTAQIRFRTYYQPKVDVEVRTETIR